MLTNKISKIVALLYKRWPDAKSELNFGNAFQLLIAVILSAHTTDKSVNRATANIFPNIKTPQAMLKFGIENLRKQIRTVGLYNNKSKNIIATCEILVANHNGKIPGTRKELESLPGVGRKTANIILNTVFKQPTLGVDTHIFRVANRTGIAEGKNTRIVEEQLLHNVPKKFHPNLHHVLLLHGRYICTAKNPKCTICVVQKLCEFYGDSCS